MDARPTPSQSELGTMSAAVARVVASALSSAQMAPQDFAELGITGAVLADPDGRVPILAVHAFMDRASELTGDPYFGLHAGERLPAGAMEVLDYATRSSRTIGEGLTRLARYYALLAENVAIKLETVGNLTRLIHDVPAGFRGHRQSTELFFAILVARGRSLTATDWPIRRVRFVHPRPTDTFELTRFFRAPLDFEQPFDELDFDSNFLEQSLVTADAGLASVLDRYVEGLITKLSRRDLWLEEVHRAVAAELPSGGIGLDATAKRLKIGSRSLQRHLSLLGTTYPSVIDDIRRELALRYLADSRIAVGEIAYLLGFSEGSAFHRAFRRWTRKTPKQYRAELADPIRVDRVETRT
jgi:AraC-like DNA-binding protein